MYIQLYNITLKKHFFFQNEYNMFLLNSDNSLHRKENAMIGVYNITMW